LDAIYRLFGPWPGTTNTLTFQPRLPNLPTIMSPPPAIAWFVSYHGFGHASRAAAVMAALARRCPGVRLELFTNCPAWIFADSLTLPFGYHPLRADIGMVQRSPLEEDPEATVQALDAWLPFETAQIERLSQTVRRLKCRLILCDISALGLAVARQAGLPGVLIENFTWDFIYAAYFSAAPGLQSHAEFFQGIYAQADLHLQTEPLCRPIPGVPCVPPIARAPRTEPDEIRRRLKIPAGAPMVLLSMGGVPDRFQFLSHLPDRIDPYIVIPGAEQYSSPHPRVILLPTHSNCFHPDLLQAADLLIGKAGYSTLAEAYLTGTPFGYIPRPQSPESPALERFIQTHLSCHPISGQDYRDGRWLALLPDLLQLPRRPAPEENGADTVARLLVEKYLT
jgi:UDP:flavonoid glycosyltransferase YjiC (YdhE family)